MSDNSIHSVEMISHTEREYRDIVTRGGIKYVKYGEQDDLPEYLNELFESSPIHGALVNSVADMAYGGGLQTENGQDPVPAILEWMRKRMFGQDGVDTMRHAFHDLKKNGITFLEVIRGSGSISTIFRSEVENWRLGALNDEREIEECWYSPNFQNPSGPNTPQRVPTWKEGTKEARSVLVIMLPVHGRKYYPRPDYFGASMYCELDKEIGTYHLNNILNGMAPSFLINFNNGAPETEEKRKMVKRKIQKDMTSPHNAGKVLLTWSNGKDKSPDIHKFELSDADKQYEQLARTVVHQILVGHRIISPMLHGVRDFSTGFGNNAEEMAMATRLFERNVLSHFRDILEKGLQPIFEEMGQKEKLYFVSPPLEELLGEDKEEPQEQQAPIVQDDEIDTGVEQEEPEAVAMSKYGMSTHQVSEAITKLSMVGDTVPDNWELVHTEPVDDDGQFKLSALQRAESFLVNLVRPSNIDKVKAEPKLPSTQDSDLYKVRYAYMPVREAEDSREFCTFMEGMTSVGAVFRYEDIRQMSFKGVNKSFGHKGQNYNLFLYKGGPYCNHFWERRIYKVKVDAESQISVNRARKEGFKPPTNPKEVAKLPTDMPRHGHHPNYGK
jgi:hypothetical protein